MNKIFNESTHPYNIRNVTNLQAFNVNTVRYGTETTSVREPQIWELVPIKESSTLNKFNSSIKQWKPVGCTCRLRKPYIPGLGLL